MYTNIINSFLNDLKLEAEAQNKHYMEPVVVKVYPGGVINIAFSRCRRSAEIEIEVENNRMEVILECGFKYWGSKIYSLDKSCAPVFGEIAEFLFKNKRKRK